MDQLKQLLPNPRFSNEAGSGGGSADADTQERAARRERRRLANSPTTADGAARSPGRNAQAAADRAGTPTRSSNRTSAAGDADMSRYGLVSESSQATPPSLEPPSPGRRRARRRMAGASGTAGTSPGLSPEHSSGALGGAHGSPRSSEGGAHRGVRQQRSFSHEPPSRGSEGGNSRMGFMPLQVPPTHSGHAEVHFIGELVGASRFEEKALYCRWQLVYDPARTWHVIRGLERGATQVSSCQYPEEDFLTWEHPIDLHLGTSSLAGWPSLLLTVYSFDDMASKEALVSYALCALPTSPGIHHLSCRTWCAYENRSMASSRLLAWYTGLHPRVDEAFILDLQRREDAGPFVCTVGSGQVHLRLQLLMKGQPGHGGGESLYEALERLQTAATTQQLKAVASAVAKKEVADTHRESEGTRLVQEGRDQRFKVAQDAIAARRSGRDQSPGSSEAGFRSRSIDTVPSRVLDRDVRSNRSAPRPRGLDRDDSSSDRAGARRPSARFSDAGRRSPIGASGRSRFEDSEDYDGRPTGRTGPDRSSNRSPRSDRRGGGYGDNDRRDRDERRGPDRGPSNIGRGSARDGPASPVDRDSERNVSYDRANSRHQREGSSSRQDREDDSRHDRDRDEGPGRRREYDRDDGIGSRRDRDRNRDYDRAVSPSQSRLSREQGSDEMAPRRREGGVRRDSSRLGRTGSARDGPDVGTDRVAERESRRRM